MNLEEPVSKTHLLLLQLLLLLLLLGILLLLLLLLRLRFLLLLLLLSLLKHWCPLIFPPVNTVIMPSLSLKLTRVGPHHWAGPNKCRESLVNP